MKKFASLVFLGLIFNGMAFAIEERGELALRCNKNKIQKAEKAQQVECDKEKAQQVECGEGALRSYTQPSGFYIGLTGMYAVPTETGLGTFIHSIGQPNSSGGVNCESEPSKAHYKPAGGIQLGYDFSGSANKIEAAYFYLHNSKYNTHPPEDVPVAFGSAFFNIGAPVPPGTPFVPSTLKYTLNQADLKFGHRLITNSCFFEFTPLVGVRFAYLKHDNSFPGGFIRSSYYGAGPMIGFDLIYNLYKGFLLIGQFDTSLLMGSVKSSSSISFFGVTNGFNALANRRIVSNFEARLGLAYDWLFWNKSSLRLEAGYEMNQYIAPFDMIVSFIAPVQRISDLATTNFAYSGPYLKLTWHM